MTDSWWFTNQSPSETPRGKSQRNGFHAVASSETGLVLCEEAVQKGPEFLRSWKVAAQAVIC